MNIHLPDSFATPLQHFLTRLVIPTITDEVLDEIYDMLMERMKSYLKGKYKVYGTIPMAVHNECLGILNRLIKEGKLGGTALCEVESIRGTGGRFLITIHWAAVRTWTSWEKQPKKTTGIKTQKWDTAHDFIFTLQDPL
jgi:hypothetical protein